MGYLSLSLSVNDCPLCSFWMWSNLSWPSLQAQAQATTMAETCAQHEEEEGEVGLSFDDQVLSLEQTEDTGWVKDLCTCLAQI